MRKVGTCILVAAGAVLLITVGAKAKINPNFTPIQLVDQSTLILVLKFATPDAKATVVAQVQETIKGKADGKTITIDLDAGKEREAVTEAAVKMVTLAGKASAILFAGEFQEEGGDEGGGGQALAPAYVHVGGKWLGLFRDKAGLWCLDGIDSNMEATWAGGSDMLLRCVRYVRSAPEPDVPVAAGTSWDSQQKIARIAGKVGRLLAVDLTGDGHLSLYAASDAGDRLFTFDKKKTAFQDVTAARGLKARSKQAVWADFNGDGRLDLASFDGKTLSLWSQAADGTFTAQPVNVVLKDGCVGLTTLDVGVRAKPGLLVTTGGAPLLLAPGKDGTLQQKAVLPTPKFADSPGKPGPCLVADLDGDTLADVLQPFEKRSVLFKGKGAGTFAAPTVNTLGLGEAPATAYAADLDHDGLLDVFVAAEDYCKVYQNLGGGTFVNFMGLVGEMTYISKPGARGAQVCDVNNDGRQDIFIWYEVIGPQIFFNRGYRSFGHAHALDLPERGLLPAAEKGQQTGLIADFNGDGAQDMVIVVPDGDVWIFYRAIYLESALAARAVLPLGGGFAGPISVTGFSDGRCLGAWNVVAGATEAFLGRIDAGPLELRWTFPGGKLQKREVILDSGPVREVLKPGT